MLVSDGMVGNFVYILIVVANFTICQHRCLINIFFGDF